MQLFSNSPEVVVPGTETNTAASAATLKHSSVSGPTPQGTVYGTLDAATAVPASAVGSVSDAAAKASPSVQLASLALSKDDAPFTLDQAPEEPLKPFGVNDGLWEHLFLNMLSEDTHATEREASLPGSNLSHGGDSDSEDPLLFSLPSSPEPLLWDYRAALSVPDVSGFGQANPSTLFTETQLGPYPGMALRSSSDPLVSSSPLAFSGAAALAFASAHMPLMAAVPLAVPSVVPSVVPSQIETQPMFNAGAMRLPHAQPAAANVLKPRANPQDSRKASTPFVQFNAPEPDGPTQQQIEAAKALKRSSTPPARRAPARRYAAKGNVRREPWMDLRPNPILMDKQIQVIAFAENNKALLKTVDLPTAAMSKAERKKKLMAAARRARRAASRPRGRPVRKCRSA